MIGSFENAFVSSRRFLLPGGYLIITWMSGWMPASYYSLDGGINWFHVLCQLLITDFFQYLMHVMRWERTHDSSLHISTVSQASSFHYESTTVWCFQRISDRYSLHDFNSLVDLCWNCSGKCVVVHDFRISVCQLAVSNALGISPCVNGLFHAIGFGAPADHHVHHKLFLFNYGPLFM